MAGDLYLIIQIEEKLGIWRDGLNLYSKINIDYTEAILGTVKKVIYSFYLGRTGFSVNLWSRYEVL